MESLRRYLKAQHGRTKALAELVGVTSGSISQWQQVPAPHVLAIEQFSGISRHELRPDVFGPPPKATPEPDRPKRRRPADDRRAA